MIAAADVSDLHLAQIRPNDWNPNKMPGPVFDRLVEEMKTVGCLAPICVVPLDEGGYQIVDGEHRWRAAKALEWPTIPAVVLTSEAWQSEELRKFVTVRANVLRGKVDPERMVKLYEEMAAKHGDEVLQNLFGYVDRKAWDGVLKTIGKQVKKSLPKDLADKLDTSAVRTVEDLGKVLNTLFNDYGDTLKHHFMVLSYGGKEHVYIQLDKPAKKALDALLDYCKSTATDLNSVVGPVTQAWVEHALANDAPVTDLGPPAFDDE